MMLAIDLERLEQADLIRRARAERTLEYLFKHVLVHETTYDSLLKQDRKRLHRLVAESLEREPEAASDGLALVLARHWDDAGETARAFEYYVRTGDAAARVYAYAEAMMAYDRAGQLAADLQLTSAQARQFYAGRGRLLELQGSYDAVLENYLAEQAWGVEHLAPEIELDALIRRTTLYTTPSKFMNLEEGLKLSEYSLQRARAMGDRPAQSKILWNMSLAHFFRGTLQDAVRTGDESLAIARELNLREQMAYTLNDLVRPYAMLGRLDEVEVMQAEAEMLWRELDNRPMLADNLTGAGMIAIFTGGYDKRLAQVEEAARITREIGNIWGQSYAAETLGYIYYWLGETARSLESFFQARDLAARVRYLDAQYDGFAISTLSYRVLGAPERAFEVLDSLINDPEAQPGWLITSHLILAILYLDSGKVDRARPHIALVEAQVDPASLSIGQILLVMVRAQLGLLEGRPADSLETVQSLMLRPDFVTMVTFRVEALIAESAAFEALDRIADAIASAQAARYEAERTKNHINLWQTYLALARLAAVQHDPASEREYNTLARAEVDYLVERAPQDLRASFLSRPEIRSLIAAAGNSERNARESSS